MRKLPIALAAGLLGVGVAACGGTGSGPASSAHSSVASATVHTETVSTVPTYAPPARVKTEVDADKDNDGGGLSGDEKNNTRTLDEFGRLANASDTRAIAALIKRYYTAALAEDGAKGCSMLYSTIEESVPEDYGTSPPSQPYLRGATCRAVLTLLFKHYHPQIALEYPKLEVVAVHLRERQGVAVLRFGKLPERELPVGREGHTWKLKALIDGELR
jgi:hypothetical protein